MARRSASTPPLGDTSISSCSRIEIVSRMHFAQIENGKSVAAVRLEEKSNQILSASISAPGCPAGSASSGAILRSNIPVFFSCARSVKSLLDRSVSVSAGWPVFILLRNLCMPARSET